MGRNLFRSAVLGGLLVAFGCGGSSDRSLAMLEVPGSLYVANLPDGSPMVLDLAGADGDRWDATYVIASDTGPEAEDMGEITGSVSGDRIEATGTTGTGKQFTLNGSVKGNGFVLTRSDYPEAPMTFKPVANPAAPSRGTVSFKVSTGGLTLGTANISDVPKATYATSSIYQGQMGKNLVMVTFWTSGDAEVSIQSDQNGGFAFKFAGVTLSNIATAKAAAKETRAWVNGSTRGSNGDNLFMYGPGTLN